MPLPAQPLSFIHAIMDGGAAGGSMDISNILTSIAGGGVGGGVLMAIVGLVKGMMNKK